MGAQTTGAISGAASGAATGTAIMPGIGTAVGAVLGAVSGWFAGKGAKAAAQLTPEQRKLFDMLVTRAQEDAAFGKQLRAMAMDPMVAHQNFVNAAANGDHDTLMRLASDDIHNLSDGARQSLQTMTQIMPRGGASAEALSSEPYKLAANQANILARTKLSAQTQQGSDAMNLMQMGNNLTQNSTSQIPGLLGFTEAKEANGAAVGAGLGSSAFDMINSIMGGKGSGAGTGTGTGTGTGANPNASLMGSFMDWFKKNWGSQPGSSTGYPMGSGVQAPTPFTGGNYRNPNYGGGWGGGL